MQLPKVVIDPEKADLIAQREADRNNIAIYVMHVDKVIHLITKSNLEGSVQFLPSIRNEATNVF